MGQEKEQTDSTNAKRRWIIIWIAVTIIGLVALLLAHVFTPISGVLGFALILAFLAGSNIALRLAAKVSLHSVISYVIYVSAVLIVLALWFLSIISIVDVVFIVVPFALAYLVLSYFRKPR